MKGSALLQLPTVRPVHLAWVWLRPDPLPAHRGCDSYGLAVDTEAPRVWWARGDAGQSVWARVPWRGVVSLWTQGGGGSKYNAPGEGHQPALGECLPANFSVGHDFQLTEK